MVIEEVADPPLLDGSVRPGLSACDPRSSPERTPARAHAAPTYRASATPPPAAAPTTSPAARARSWARPQGRRHLTNSSIAWTHPARRRRRRRRRHLLAAPPRRPPGAESPCSRPSCASAVAALDAPTPRVRPPRCWCSRRKLGDADAVPLAALFRALRLRRAHRRAPRHWRSSRSPPRPPSRAHAARACACKDRLLADTRARARRATSTAPSIFDAQVEAGPSAADNNNIKDQAALAPRRRASRLLAPHLEHVAPCLRLRPKRQEGLRHDDARLEPLWRSRRHANAEALSPAFALTEPEPSTLTYARPRLRT